MIFVFFVKSIKNSSRSNFDILKKMADSRQRMEPFKKINRITPHRTMAQLTMAQCRLNISRNAYMYIYKTAEKSIKINKASACFMGIFGCFLRIFIYKSADKITIKYKINKKIVMFYGFIWVFCCKEFRLGL